MPEATSGRTRTSSLHPPQWELCPPRPSCWGQTSSFCPRPGWLWQAGGLVAISSAPGCSQAGAHLGGPALGTWEGLCPARHGQADPIPRAVPTTSWAAGWRKGRKKPCSNDAPAADPHAWPGHSFWWEETQAAGSFVSCKPLQNWFILKIKSTQYQSGWGLSIKLSTVSCKPNKSPEIAAGSRVLAHSSLPPFTAKNNQ